MNLKSNIFPNILRLYYKNAACQKAITPKHKNIILKGLKMTVDIFLLRE